MTSAVEKLAVVPCPELELDNGDYFTGGCPRCHGTGALIPGLRRKCLNGWCQGRVIALHKIPPSIVEEDCPRCQGRGWTLKPVAEQMGVLVRRAEFCTVFWDRTRWVAHINGGYGEGDIPEEALADAIYQAYAIRKT